MMPCNRCAKSVRVAFCLQHLFELLLDERPQIGDLDVLVGARWKSSFSFSKLILLKSQVLPDCVMRNSGSRFVDAASSVDHEAFVEQFADPHADGIDVRLLDDGVHNAAQILEDRHRAHDRTAENLGFARFVEAGDRVFVNGEALPPLVLRSAACPRSA